MRELRDVSESEVERALEELVSAATSFALGTVDQRGEPHVSYVPYACVGGAFVFVVSGLAAHARHLAERRIVSGLIVRAGATEPYSCARLTTMGPVRGLRAETQSAEAAWASLERRHGEIVAVLRTLPDFSAYAYEPERGRLVLGFARAYDLASDAISAAVWAAERA